MKDEYYSCECKGVKRFFYNDLQDGDAFDFPLGSNAGVTGHVRIKICGSMRDAGKYVKLSSGHIFDGPYRGEGVEVIPLPAAKIVRGGVE